MWTECFEIQRKTECIKGSDERSWVEVTSRHRRTSEVICQSKEVYNDNTQKTNEIKIFFRFVVSRRSGFFLLIGLKMGKDLVGQKVTCRKESSANRIVERDERQKLSGRFVLF